MELINFIVAMAVVIVATLNFGAQGFPRPQANIRDSIVFERPTSGSRTPPNSPPVGPSNIDRIVFERTTSGSRTSPNNPPIGPSNVDRIVFERPTSGSRTSPKDPLVGPTKIDRIVFDEPSTQSPVVDQSPVPTTVRPDVALCVQNCKATSEYNPVCGSDGVKYNNAGLLICARNCGINVRQLRPAPCPIKLGGV